MITGSVPPRTGRNFKSRALTGRWGIFTPAATILQVSITEPPPRATMQSAPLSSASFRPASIVGMEGSE